MKMKTRKIVAKRFNVTKNGKILRRSQGTRHLRSHKSKRQMRSLSQTHVVHKNMKAEIKSFLPYL
jgi:large subunit ribosomal protein L35